MDSVMIRRLFVPLLVMISASGRTTTTLENVTTTGGKGDSLGYFLPKEDENKITGRVFRDCGVCPEMVVLPTGSYQMGSSAGEEDRWDAEGPRHTVRIGYVLVVGKHEVTFSEWDACVDGGGCGGYRPDDLGWGRGRRPVMNVSREDAREYVSWLSRETGEAYRLRARRSGSTRRGRGRRPHGIGGKARRSSADTRTGGTRRYYVATDTSPPRRWARLRRTDGDCTTCWGTCGSGRRTAGTTATRGHPATGAFGREACVPFLCCVAALG